MPKTKKQPKNLDEYIKKAESINVNIGAAIEEGLQRKGWSQKKLAETLGVPPSLVNGWIRGHKMPRGDIILKVAATLDIIHTLFPSKAGLSKPLPSIKEELQEIKKNIEKIEKKFAEMWSEKREDF